MDTTCSHDFSDTRTIVFLLLHLQSTHHSIDPDVHSSDESCGGECVVSSHLFQNNLEHLIDRIVGGSPPIPVVSDTILSDLYCVFHTCGGLTGLLSQDNRFCMRRIGPYQDPALTNTCIHVLQEWKDLRV